MDTFNPNQMPPLQTQTEKKSVGPLVAVVIILVLIVIGSLYFLKMRSSEQNYVPTTTVPAGDSITESLNSQSNSDDLNSIEADLNATNLDNLDQGAAVLEAELNIQ